jgi:C1A family cysteine protease
MCAIVHLVCGGGILMFLGTATKRNHWQHTRRTSEMTNYYYGGELDTFDPSDEIYSFDESSSNPAAAQVIDLSIYIGPMVYDQAPLKACTANAVCAAYVLYVKMTRGVEYSEVDPSRLFLHYNARTDHVIDKGVNVCDAIKAFEVHGVCKESLWSYEPSKVNTPPPQKLYDGEAEGGIECKKRIANNLDDFKACLDESCPFVFSFNTYGSLEHIRAESHYIMPKPNFSGAPKAHTVMAVGYDDKKGLIKVLNSWGPEFGDGGYFYIPYHMMKDPKLFGDRGSGR